MHATPGDVIKFRFGAYFDVDAVPIITTADGTGTARTLCLFTGSNQAVGFAAGDQFQNVVRTISDGGAAISQINGSTIGDTAPESFGSQSFVDDVPFETYTEVLRGEVRIGGSLSLRVIELKNKTFGTGNVAGLTFYNSASPINKQSGAPQPGGPGRADLIASILLIASLVLFSVGGVMAARRRRA